MSRFSRLFRLLLLNHLFFFLRSFTMGDFGIELNINVEDFFGLGTFEEARREGVAGANEAAGSE